MGLRTGIGGKKARGDGNGLGLGDGGRCACFALVLSLTDFHRCVVLT